MKAAALAICALAALSPASAELTVKGPWMDHAVIQRGRSLVIEGTTDAARVAVSFGAGVAEAESEDGRWRVELPPMAEGNPGELVIRAGGEELRFRDVAVGEVLLCSGQSNMAWPVARATGSPDPALAGSDDIRLLKIPTAHSAAPRDALPEGAAWAPASDGVGGFSAVCWYTAERSKEEGVPLGLIDASWGGSQIEAWLPQAALEEVGGFEEELALLRSYKDDPAEAMAAYGGVWEDWWRKSHRGEPWKRAHPDWTAVPPGKARDWKSYGDSRAEEHYGGMWFTKTFELTEGQAGSPAILSIGLVDDVDATWVNGAFVGSTFSWSDPRRYSVPEGILRPGRNRVTVNVLNGYGQGGLLGPNDAMQITFGEGEAVPLDDGWRYAAVEDGMDGVPSPPWNAVAGYSTIHNAMIAPLGQFPVARALWYQGESNAGRAEAYEALLGALIDSWNARFGDGLETVIVQLPMFGARPVEPGPSGWATLREAQRQAALSRPDVGLAVTVDTGDPTDIHPTNKVVVADRVASVFGALADDEAGADGWGPADVAVKGERAVVTFGADGLESPGHGGVVGFQACMEGGSCRWTQASLDGGAVAVELPAGTDELRYCWADTPLCNLYTEGGAPVTPFRLSLPGDGE